MLQCHKQLSSINLTKNTHVLTGSYVWHHWYETGTAPQSLVRCCRWCMGSPLVWKLKAHRKNYCLIFYWSSSGVICFFWILWSDLVLWKGHMSPSVSSWSSVFYASCPRSAAGPSVGCWRRPGRWSRSGRGCYCCYCCYHPSPAHCSIHQWVSSSAELLLVLFGRLLLKWRYNYSDDGNAIHQIRKKN